MQGNDLYYVIATIAVISLAGGVLFYSLFKRIKELSSKISSLTVELENAKNESNSKDKERRSVSLSLLSEIAHLVYIQKVANIALRSLTIKERDQVEEAKLQEALRVCELVGNQFNQRHEKIIKSIGGNSQIDTEKENA